MRKKLLLTGVFLACMPVLNVKADICTAGFAEALKSNYTHTQEGTISEMLFEAACQSSGGETSTGLTLGIPGVADLAFSDVGKSVSEACFTTDRNFFSRHSSKLVFSFLPENAIKLLANCFGGLKLGAQNQDNIITITAAFADPYSSRKAVVENFTWEPNSAVVCNPEVLTEGVELIPGGKTQICRRLSNQTVNFTINTDLGTDQVWIKKPPEVEIVEYDWSYDVGSPTHLTKCKNQEGCVGPWHDCRQDRTCDNAVAIIGLCLYRYGKGKVEVNGRTIEQKDEWGYFVGGGRDTGWTTCTVNKEAIGTPHDCRADRTCDHPTPIIGMCAGRYGVR